MATDILLSGLTDGNLVNNEWVGTGVFDVLIEAVNKNIEGQYNKGRINGSDYANVYLGSLQAVIAQSMQFLLQEKQVEANIDLAVTQKSELEQNGIKDRLLKEANTNLANKQVELTQANINLTNEKTATQAELTNKAESDAAIAEINEAITAATQNDKITTSSYKLLIEGVNKDVAVGTKQHKIDLVKGQVDKLAADTDYVGAQQKALEEQVVDNRLIKVLDVLGETFGTFGAGGINLDEEMWGVYFTLAAKLSDELGQYVGAWNPVTNTPNLNTVNYTADDIGKFYRCSANGNGSVDVSGMTEFYQGDLIVWTGERFEKSVVAIPSTTNISVVS